MIMSDFFKGTCAHSSHKSVKKKQNNAVFRAFASVKEHKTKILLDFECNVMCLQIPIQNWHL